MVVYVKKTDKLEYISGHIVPLVGELFVHTLSMTLDVPEDLQAQVVDGFLKAEKLGDGEKVSKTAYKHNLKLSTEYEPDVLIQCQPYKAGNRFFRIEFMVQDTDLGNLKKNIDYILPGGYSHLIKEGVVTRIDLTVDVSYLGAMDIVASKPKVKTVRIFAKNGAIETKYLGDYSSSSHTVLYDKVAQIIHANSKKNMDAKKEVPPHDVFRIEHRFKKLDCTLGAVASLPNPFKDLTLIAYPGSMSPKHYDPLWTLFLSACRFEGQQIALSHLNKEQQVVFKKRLKNEGRTDWWDPDKVWEGIPKALHKLINIKDYNPTQGISISKLEI